MSRDLASRPPEITLTIAAAPAPLLDRALDWQLDWACRTVSEPAHGRPRVEFVVDAGAQDPDEFWHAANARAAELCWKHRVEVLLVQEGGELRIVVERHEPTGSDRAAAGEETVPASRRSRGLLTRLRALFGQRAARSVRSTESPGGELGAKR